MRVRQTSLPASLVQSRHYSLVGSSGLSASALGSAGAKRISVASFASIGSFDSLPEEGEGEDGEEGAQPAAGRPALSRRSLSPPASRRTSVASRSSLPPGASAYRAFSVVRPRTTSASTRAGSPSPGEARSAEDRAKRAERRWRIAEEMRETEKAYVQVLEEIDALYYQPLIEALPLDDPLSRRSSKRYSALSGGDSPKGSPRHSLYAPAARSRTSTADSVLSSAASSSAPPVTPPNGPILSRREINEVFSNFTDVLNLSHVMLLALDEAVPPRPSQPVSISPSASAATLADAQVSRSAPAAAAQEAQSSSIEDALGGLSRSGGTVDSEGPETPAEGDLPPSRPLRKASTPRQRTLSTRSARGTPSAPPAPPLRLGRALLPILPFLKQYSLFVANFSSSLSLLSRLDGSSSAASSSAGPWHAFVLAQQQLSGAGSQASRIGLAGLLLNIVQRVPRYRLLLQDLLRHTEADHPDARDLQAAFELVDGVASHLDSQIQAHTNALAILDLQRAFLPGSFPSSPLLAPGRALLRFGPLSQRSHAGGTKPRVFFLFSDLLLVASAEDAWIAEGERYRLVGRYGLEDVTVVGSDEVDEEGRRRCGFEVLSSERSFAVYADSVEDRNAWLDAIRDAKAALTSARATLQRSSAGEPFAPLSSASPLNPKLDRRISLPPPSPSPVTSTSPLARSRSTTANLAVPGPLHRQVSMPPSVARIPPNPAEEIDRLVFPSSPGGSATAEVVQSPLESPALFGRDDRGGDAPPALDLASSSVAAVSPSHRPAPLVRPSLARSRRWSDLPTSSAFLALSSLLTSTPPDLAPGETAYPVIDAYQAPVWVPDARAPRCQCCAKAFGVWRRKHHCRLCGGVVCWECSTKYFIVPWSLLSSSSTSSSSTPSTSASTPQPDRLARACDTCFTSVFAPTTPASRFLTSHPAADLPLPHPAPGAGAGRGSVKWTGTWRLSKALGPGAGGLEPLWDVEELAAAAAGAAPAEGKENAPAGTPPRRTRKRSAVNQLKALLRE
ncbi:hypothetical protein JCM10450v2_007383 [Rhodotorula kratochvilovae]